MQGADSTLAKRGWRHFASVHHALRPPLRPTGVAVGRIRRAIEGRDRRALLLGVTPELSVIGSDLTAVDNSPRMLADVWPGDSADRRAVLGDWTELPFASGSFDAVIGDASLNAAPEQVEEVVAEVRRVLAKDGKTAFRLFCAPEEPEALDSIEHDVANGWIGNVHALKWRIAMSLASSTPQAVVPVFEILNTFDRMFPDRKKLAAETGWSAEDIVTLDAYVGADHSLAFPTLSSALGLLGRHFRDIMVIEAVDYPLADRCPTVVCAN